MNVGDDNERALGFVLLLVVGAVVLPALLPAVRDAVTAWALSHSLLVPAAQATVTIPGTMAGLDIQRLLAAGLAVLALALFALAVQRHSPRSRGERR
jgi:hypothetical protein